MGFIGGVITGSPWPRVRPRGTCRGLGRASGIDTAWTASSASSVTRSRRRTRDVRSKVEAQVAEVRTKATANGPEAIAGTLDDAQAAAAEEAAELAADVEDKAAKVKRAAKPAEPE